MVRLRVMGSVARNHSARSSPGEASGLYVANRSGSMSRTWPRVPFLLKGDDKICIMNESRAATPTHPKLERTTGNARSTVWVPQRSRAAVAARWRTRLTLGGR